MRRLTIGRSLIAFLVMAGGLAGIATLPGVTLAGEFAVAASERPDLKAVFGRVESRDMVAARARLGGTIVSLDVEEGTAVKAGDIIAMVVDDKLALQLGAVDSRLKALDAELQNAVTELERAKKLAASGVIPKNRLDALQTQVDVLTNQLAAARAERSVLEQQRAEGEVVAPAPGRVLAVPVTKGSVVMPGETVARIAGGGYFLRLSLPERHASQVKEGDEVLVGGRTPAQNGGDTAKRQGHIVKVYPEIEGGRVLADVEVDGLGDFFVGERTRVWIQVASRRVFAIPQSAVNTRYGIDYVHVLAGGGGIDVPVITGESFEVSGVASVEILTGLQEGDKVKTP